MIAHVEILHVTKHTQKPSSITIKVLLVRSTLAFDCSAEWSISPNVYGFERSLLFLLTHLASGSTHFLGSLTNPLDSQPTLGLGGVVDAIISRGGDAVKIKNHDAAKYILTMGTLCLSRHKRATYARNI